MENFKRYQSATPPKYKLSNVQTKMHLIFGTNDNLVSPKVGPHKMRTHLKKTVDLHLLVCILHSFSCFLILQKKCYKISEQQRIKNPFERTKGKWKTLKNTKNK